MNRSMRLEPDRADNYLNSLTPTTKAIVISIDTGLYPTITKLPSGFHKNVAQAGKLATIVSLPDGIAWLTCKADEIVDKWVRLVEFTPCQADPPFRLGQICVHQTYAGYSHQTYRARHQADTHARTHQIEDRE